MEATEGSEGEDDQEMLGQYYARTRHVITYWYLLPLRYGDPGPCRGSKSYQGVRHDKE